MGNLFTKKNQSYELLNPISTLVSKSQEFCQTSLLSDAAKKSTQKLCSISSLLDHILTNPSKKISQKGVIDQEFYITN